MRRINGANVGDFAKSSIFYRYFYNNQFWNRHSNAIHIGICIVGGLLAFLPLFTHKQWSVHFDAMDHLGLYRSSSSVALTLLIPMGLETLLEIYYNRHGPTMHSIKLSMDALSTAERLLLMVGLAIAPCIGAFDIPSITAVDNLSLVYMCCRKSQNILVLGAVMTSLSRYKSQYWHGPTTAVSLVGLVLGQVNSLYYNLCVLEGQQSSSASLYAATMFF